MNTSLFYNMRRFETTETLRKQRSQRRGMLWLDFPVGESISNPLCPLCLCASVVKESRHSRTMLNCFLPA
jgi:hypothetical protein